MRALAASYAQRTLSAAVLAGLFAFVASPAAPFQERMKKADEADGPAAAKQAPPPAKSKGPTYSLEFREKPWASVFDWLRDTSNLPVVTQYIPTGTVNLNTPKGMQYTLPEVIDLLNETLLASRKATSTSLSGASLV